MTIFLLIIIYLVFISLGLPDSVIGSSWPSIASTFNVGEDYQGILTIIISLCTVISTFLSVPLNKKINTKWIVISSIGLTCIGIVCMSYSSNFLLMCLSAIPFGLGAGAIDSTLNNYVALHYKALHMNFLHAFWGVGTICSPFIISYFLTTSSEGWRTALLVLAGIQVSIFLITFSTVFVWKKAESIFESRKLNTKEENNKISLGFFKSFKIKGIIWTIIAFFCYCGLETTIGSWFSSMMSYTYLNVDNSLSSQWVAYFYIGITCSRLLFGLLSLKITDQNRIRIGEGIILLGVILLMLNKFGYEINYYLMPISVLLIGFGCGPIYPAIIHATPDRFTEELSLNVMSLQIGCAYISNVTISPLFGVLAKNINLNNTSNYLNGFLILPYVILGLLIILIVGNELVLIRTKDKTKLLDKIKS